MNKLLIDFNYLYFYIFFITKLKMRKLYSVWEPYLYFPHMPLFSLTFFFFPLQEPNMVLMKIEYL